MKERRPIDPIFGEVQRYEPPPETSETTPIEPPATEPQPLPILSKIPELKVLIKEVGGGLSDWTWDYPGVQNGQPREQIRRHLYNLLLKQECPHCHEQVTTYIDIGRLTAGPHCVECNGNQKKPEIIRHSYLLYELERKPKDATISNDQGYVADDPRLESEPLWTPGGIFHLGAPMGSGKSTLIRHSAIEARESGAITIIVVPRLSLALGVHAELREHTDLGWKLFHEGSEKGKPKSERWQIGEYGAVCTLGILPHLLKHVGKQDPNRPIRIFVDEIDFAASLWLADIFKSLSREIKEKLRERKDDIGIVTAGQTASTLALEAIAQELGAELTGYYMTPRPIKQTARLMVISSDDVDQPMNRLVQAVIDKAAGILSKGKRVNLFCDSRRDAAIVANVFGDKALLWDAYHSKDPEHQELIRLKRLPDDKKVFVATTAVDVGVSFEDADSEVIVLRTTNPLTGADLDSTVQQCFRNRALPPIHIFMLRYQNALPLTPTEATGFLTKNAKQKLNPDEDVPAGLIKQLGVSDAMRTLAADQPEDFTTYHLRQAGVEVQMKEVDWESVDFDKVQKTRKQITDFEKEQVKAMVLDILRPGRMLTESEIRNKDWEQSQPQPVNQLGNELANALLRAAGWDGKVESFDEVGNTLKADPVQAFQDAGVTDDMWEAAKMAARAELSPDKNNNWRKGYLTKHYPEVAFWVFKESSGYEIPHRSDALFIGSLVKALLDKLPLSLAPMEAFGQALIDAAQTLFGTDRLSGLLKDGSVSPAIAKKVRFLGLGRDAQPTESHFEFVKWFISTYFPARIAKVDDSYQLAAPTKTGQVEAFEAVTACLIAGVKRREPNINLEPESGDTPPLPPATDPKAESKASVVQMRNDGHSYREIESLTGTSRSTAQRWDAECHIRPTNFLYSTYIRNEWDTPSSPESPQPPATTAFEADSANVISDVTFTDMTSDIRHPTFREQILRLLETGEKQTGGIVECIAGNRVAIMNELKSLCDAGEIVKPLRDGKPRRGVYDLPIRAYSIEMDRHSKNGDRHT